ncbi:MAG: T9SS C-terminal target domain-containing protein [Chitinophagaceae bacterium]|jgi:Secretion system C-terminal sorting domain|nr:T9SS C-terminal target domain-containing protein [Chitinophagaceae bacterium]
MGDLTCLVSKFNLLCGEDKFLVTMNFHFIRGTLILLLSFTGFFSFSQTCPTYVQRNNGNNTPNDCGSTAYLPAGYSKTGSFQFNGVNVDLAVVKVEKWSGSAWETYQDNTISPAVYNNAYFFGGYNNVTDWLCFYGSSGNNGVPPAANWRFYFKEGSNAAFTCTYNINASGVLPLTWNFINAEKQNGQVLLNWSTASEQNTKDFEVQYSTNTTNWDLLGTIQAAGNSNSTRNYSFTHQTPLKNNTYNYYRILQRDIDGKFSYSKIVSIIFNEPGPDMSVYPNPVSDVLTVYLSESKLVRLSNAAGAIVWQSNLPAGRNQISVSQYSKGVYVLTAGVQSYRVLIQ